ncbi:hypothetical protein [Microbacterium sp.]|uniref:hypothetical protein n=1 Tax=Microbacterium sp. TaxID=51671 RepID=UPI00092ADB6D|nr:hypothetical protein [Microbacterium sp.]MBN9190571.1 hypothetical protein [Microbacterium sp.]MBN9193950.1 hypothetical protein [Microbacterium sp.]OJU70159.1 MAG: hypothetical protein BGO04_05635 [Microbacterium sp. 70-38]
MTYSASLDKNELRTRAEQQLLRLNLPAEVGLADIVRHVAVATGKQIDIEPVGDKDWENVTGLVLLSPDAARILVRKSDPRWYQFHTVLHELSHVLFEHTGCATLPVKHPASEHMRAGQTVLARGVATPDFEVDLDFSDSRLVMEAEAEKLSQLLSRLVLRPRHIRDEAVFG